MESAALRRPSRAEAVTAVLVLIGTPRGRVASGGFPVPQERTRARTRQALTEGVREGNLVNCQELHLVNEISGELNN